MFHETCRSLKLQRTAIDISAYLNDRALREREVKEKKRDEMEKEKEEKEKEKKVVEAKKDGIEKEEKADELKVLSLPNISKAFQIGMKDKKLHEVLLSPSPLLPFSYLSLFFLFLFSYISLHILFFSRFLFLQTIAPIFLLPPLLLLSAFPLPPPLPPPPPPLPFPFPLDGASMWSGRLLE